MKRLEDMEGYLKRRLEQVGYYRPPYEPSLLSPGDPIAGQVDTGAKRDFASPPEPIWLDCDGKPIYHTVPLP